MTTAMINKTDVRLRDAIQQQLEWDPDVDTSDIGMTAREGVVTLTGYIDTYAGKLAAERAVKRVRGVRAVANELQVRLKLDRIDTDIATDVVHALNLRATLPENVQSVVRSGHVTLTGTVPTLFDKAVAAKAIRYVRGVKSIANRVTVVPRAQIRDVRERIVQALHRTAGVDARNIEVGVSGTTATLDGEVGYWIEREAAERAAMHAPGITAVDNRITVAWPAASGHEGVDETC